MEIPIDDAPAITLLPVPLGSFRMGSTAGLPLEQPPHDVRFHAPFWLAETLITTAQYSAVMGDLASEGHRTSPKSLPVDSVSYADALIFCDHVERASGVPLRLPTEAEWEYACRAGTASEYFFGDDVSMLGDFAWYDRNADDSRHPVRTKRPNPWGFYDLSGNVWEWCADTWHSTYEGASFDGSIRHGPASQPRRVLRGGSSELDAFRCRSAYRSREWGSARL
jgi:formylglycine-generating enzyme required for sulfatase activity